MAAPRRARALRAVSAGAALLAAAALALAGAAGTHAAAPPSALDGPKYDPVGRIVDEPIVPRGPHALLTSSKALHHFEANGKVAAWLTRYPSASLQTDATWDSKSDTWTVKIWSGAAGEIAQGTVQDNTGVVSEAWTGPQVAWSMARGTIGSFGGDLANSGWVWLGLGAAFALGLADLRRPLALRNLDIAVLLSLLGSLWLFNDGNVFAAVPLAMAPLAWLLARLGWIGSGKRRQARRPHRPLVPVWVLIALTVFAFGLRVGMNAADSNVIDVGYAGVIGAQRIATGQAPWGHFPIEDPRPACGPADSAGEIRDHIQTNGRCESSNPRGDTYGPFAYEAYLPGFGVAGWNGKWDTGRGWSALPAVHATSVLWDALAIVGLFLVGLRFGGRRFGAILAFAWATYPLTFYAFMSNTNDAIAPAVLVWGFWLVTSPWARGSAVALAGWTKLGTLVLAPLWATYPDAARVRPLRARHAGRFAAGFLAATLAAFSVLLLEPDLAHAIRVFAERTFSWQFGRHSPFSLWDWGQYHARGIPDLKPLQRLLQLVLVVAAVGLAFFPRGRRSPLQLAALSGALIIGFELVLTHWSWLYLPWLFPFAAIALLAPPRTGAVIAAAPAAPFAPAPPAPEPATVPGPEEVDPVTP